MFIENNKAKDVRIAYIGGGSRGWAWKLMSDLTQAEDMQGHVALYDIDYAAALANEIIGGRISDGKSGWTYKAYKTIGEALTGADFVVISILPGTFREMQSDVHAPEKYGIYQPVGDSTGPGGIIRALRTVPMYEVIAEAIRDFCPDAWVINYTNPMTVCVNTLYRVFPGIKAFGCCHEVFGTQTLLMTILEEKLGIKAGSREDIRVNVVGVNHFTWLTSAYYKNIDLFPLYREYAKEHRISGARDANESIELNKEFICRHKVKFDLFLRHGYIAAAGDRHLAEFCPGNWYLNSDEEIEKKWGFARTSVAWRLNELDELLEKSKKLVSGEEQFKLEPTGEDGVKQMRAILGLSDLVTNVNMPNIGQIPNLPLGAVVETNAYFTSGKVQPVMAGKIPESILPLVGRIAAEQEIITTAAMSRELDLAFSAFLQDPLVNIKTDDAKKLFDEMIDNTSSYLTMYKR